MKEKLNSHGFPKDIMIDYDVDCGKISFGATMELVGTFDMIEGDGGVMCGGGGLSGAITESAMESMLRLIPKA